jgi:hypothetical protein
VARDWQAWYEQYDDPTSGLVQRLAVVVRMIGEALDRAAPGPIRVLSLCAGDARDLTTAAAGHPRAGDLSGCAVELDTALAERAVANLRSVAPAVEVRRGDAGDPAAWADVVTVDLLLLCGIFGNVPEEDIERTATTSGSLCRPGATVIWTRHRRPPDLTPRVRGWFAAAGFSELAFESGGPGGFGVGVARFDGRGSRPDASPLDHGKRVFTFTAV